MKTQYKLSALALIAATVLTGCLPGGGGGGPTGLDGGLFKSVDEGLSWRQYVDLMAIRGEVRRFPDESIFDIEIDPQDHEVIYLATQGNGLFYSQDGGISWTQDKTIRAVKVNDIAIDYFDRCKWVIATQNKVIRTLDCGRGWREMLSEAREGFYFVEVVTDHFNRNVVYAANNKEILKTTDYGENWRTVARFDKNITDIVMDRSDSRIIYVTFANGGGIQKTTDGGGVWTDVSEGLKEFKGGTTISSITQSLSEKNTFLVTSDYGLLKTTDGGTTWTAFELLTPPGSVVLRAVGVHPVNPKVIIYTTDTTLYKTIDGGVTWKTAKLPTTRRADELTFDFKDGNVIYLGAKKIEK